MDNTTATATVTITANERAMLTAMATSEFAEDPTDDIWIVEVCGPFGASAGGVMASLVSKGLARTTGHINGAFMLDEAGRSTGFNEGTCGCTPEGAAMVAVTPSV